MWHLVLVKLYWNWFIWAAWNCQCFVNSSPHFAAVFTSLIVFTSILAGSIA